MASGAAKRYVQAIVELAREQGTFDKWERELAAIAQLRYEPSVIAYLENPSIHEADKRNLVDGAIKDVSPEARNLVHMLIARKRTQLIPDIVAQFEEQALLERGTVVAEVTTAEPVDATAEAAIAQQLSKIAGKEVHMRFTTDESIIGGIKAKIGDQVIDGTVVNQLRRLRQRLVAG